MRATPRIGEFHLYGADAELPVLRRMVQLARSTAWCCTRMPMPMRSSGCSGRTRRRASCGRTRASNGPSGWRDAAQAPEPVVRPGLPQRARLRRQGAGRNGARCSASSRTASWSAPTPSRPSAGTTWSSMRAGRAPGSPTCRRAGRDASPGATPRRCSRTCEAQRAVKGGACWRRCWRRRAAAALACGEALGAGARRWRGAAAADALHALPDPIAGGPALRHRRRACAPRRDAALPADAARRRDDARAPPRHELPAQRHAARRGPVPRRRADVPHARALGVRLRAARAAARVPRERLTQSLTIE